MEGDQPSMGPPSPTVPEDSEKTNKKNSVISPMENQVSIGGSSSTSNNSQARSYECIFCKRGFANAQALGGHMNIHRKDKEKLKHNDHVTLSIDQTARLMDGVIPRMIQHWPQSPPSAPPVVSWGNWMIQDEGKKAEVKGRDDDNQTSSKSGEVRKLPLFIDQPLNKMDREEQSLARDGQDAVPTSRACEDVEKDKPSSEGHGSSEVSTTVDLELRLGPEPTEPSSQPLSTRKFF